jgi:hypothetical protein
LNIHFDCSNFSKLVESFDTNWSEFLTNIATAAVIHVLHSIWLARNAICFNNAKVSTHAAKIKVLTSCKLSATLALGLSRTADNAILQVFNIAPRPAVLPVVKLVLWRSPTFGWIKANTDGSVTNTPAACRGLFRDYTARFRGCFAQNISGAHGLSVIHTEIMALIIAICYGNLT